MPAKKLSKAAIARKQREVEAARLEWQRMIATRIYNSTGRKMGVLAGK